jgi:hypothetical protein
MAVATPSPGPSAVIPSLSPLNYAVVPTSTPTALDSMPCYQVSFHAALGNSGVVVVGGEDLELVPDPNGVELGPGDSYTYAIANADLLRHASNDADQELHVEVKRL